MEKPEKTIATHTEDKLISQLQNSESRNLAFHELVKLYEKRIYWHVRKLVVDHDDADDLVQETFVKAWHAIADFRSDSKLYTWLYRIATNEALMFLRKKNRRRTFLLSSAGSELSSKLESPAHFTGTLAERLLHQAILTLPEKQRVVFNLKYFDELTYEDMAEITETSVGALKASYHHAVKKIENYVKKGVKS